MTAGAVRSPSCVKLTDPERLMKSLLMAQQDATVT